MNLENSIPWVPLSLTLVAQCVAPYHATSKFAGLTNTQRGVYLGKVLVMYVTERSIRPRRDLVREAEGWVSRISSFTGEAREVWLPQMLGGLTFAQMTDAQVDEFCRRAYQHWFALVNPDRQL